MKDKTVDLPCPKCGRDVAIASGITGNWAVDDEPVTCTNCGQVSRVVWDSYGDGDDFQYLEPVEDKP